MSRKVKRIMMKTLVPLGKRVTDQTVDAGGPGEVEMWERDTGVEVHIKDEPDPRLVPYSNLAVVIFEQDTASELAASREPTEPDGRRGRR